MAKIISVKKKKKEQVYNLEMKSKHHNYILNNGMISANSHAVSYGFIALQTAYLKAHYTIEMITACMSHDYDNIDQMIAYLNECKRLGFEVLPPDINLSKQNFSIIGDNQIRFGFENIKGIGINPAKEILNKRFANNGYNNFQDFCSKVNIGIINKAKLEALSLSGAFDSFGIPRKSLFSYVPAYLEYNAARNELSKKRYKYKKAVEAYEERLEEIRVTGGYKMKPRKQKDGSYKDVKVKIQSLKKPTPLEEPVCPPIIDFGELNNREILAYEHNLLNVFLSGHPIEELELSESNGFDTLETIKNFDTETPVQIIALISTIKQHTIAKSKKMMAFLKLEDMTTTCEAVIFPKKYEKFKDELVEGEPLFIEGVVDITENDEGIKIAKLKVNSIKLINNTPKNKKYAIILSAKNVNKLDHLIKSKRTKRDDYEIELAIKFDSGYVIKLNKSLYINLSRTELFQTLKGKKQ